MAKYDDIITADLTVLLTTAPMINPIKKEIMDLIDTGRNSISDI